MFKLIKEVWPEFKPEIIYVDYKPAMLKTIKDMFREAEIFGCFFHLRQNLKKKIERTWSI